MSENHFCLGIHSSFDFGLKCFQTHTDRRHQIISINLPKFIAIVCLFFVFVFVFCFCFVLFCFVFKQVQIPVEHKSALHILTVVGIGISSVCLMLTLSFYGYLK